MLYDDDVLDNVPVNNVAKQGLESTGRRQN
jgi:hypothetical protein